MVGGNPPRQLINSHSHASPKPAQTCHWSRNRIPKNPGIKTKCLKTRSTNGKLVVWIGGLGFESGYPEVTIPFIRGSQISKPLTQIANSPLVEFTGPLKNQQRYSIHPDSAFSVAFWCQVAYFGLIAVSMLQTIFFTVILGTKWAHVGPY